MVDLFYFVLGVAVVTFGADLLVGGATAVARRLRVPALVVGLTIVACGTSAPEIVTGVFARLTDHADMAVGGVVGSNIFNLLFILGATVLLAPGAIHERLVRIDVPVLVVLSALAMAMAFDGSVGPLDGLALLLGFAGYAYLSIRLAGGADASPPGRDERCDRPDQISMPLALARIGLGVLALGAGSYWVVAGATALARAAGMSELVIGLTLVSASTGLPELVTSLVAAVRKQRDVAIGNVVGSSIVNILLVLGLLGIAAPGGTPVASAVLRFDMPVMLATAVACLPLFATGSRMERWEGVVLLGYYAAYAVFLVLDARGHDALPAYSMVMAAFVMPLTVLTFVVVAWRERSLRTRRDSRLPARSALRFGSEQSDPRYAN